MQAAARRRFNTGAAPDPQDLAALRLRQQRQVREAGRRLVHDFREQRPPVPEQTLDGRRIEQEGVVFRRGAPSRARRAARHAQQQIELGGAVVDAAWGEEQLPGPPRRERLLEGEHHLEQRIAPQVAHRVELLDQALEGEVLMGIGPQAGPARPRQ